MALDVIRDVRDAVTAAEEARAAYPGSLWWRGNAKAGWTLVPKVHRPPKGAPNREQNLAYHFQAQAGTRYAGCPPRADYVAWLFLMQHYGLATRLLDWTWSVLTALFFAVNDPLYDTEVGALWMLRPMVLNATQGYRLGLPVPEAVGTFFQTAFSPQPGHPTGLILAVATHEVDVRMMVQLSAFTIHDTDKPLEGLVADHSQFLRKYEILASAKPHIRSQLELLGINSANLFPDLDHLARDLNSTIP